jgi:hypothetical protein
MSYSDFDLKTAIQTFGLTEDRRTDLFAAVESLEPSEHLAAWLKDLAPVALGVISEKAQDPLAFGGEPRRARPPALAKACRLNLKLAQ